MWGALWRESAPCGRLTGGFRRRFARRCGGSSCKNPPFPAVPPLDLQASTPRIRDLDRLYGGVPRGPNSTKLVRTSRALGWRFAVAAPWRRGVAEERGVQKVGGLSARRGIRYRSENWPAIWFPAEPVWVAPFARRVFRGWQAASNGPTGGLPPAKWRQGV